MSDRCQSHKCRACSKCAETEALAREDATIAATGNSLKRSGHTFLNISHGDGNHDGIDEIHLQMTSGDLRMQQGWFDVTELRAAIGPTDAEIEKLRREVERLTVVVDQEARARQHAESEVARLKSYIAAGVGGAS